MLEPGFSCSVFVLRSSHVAGSTLLCCLVARMWLILATPGCCCFCGFCCRLCSTLLSPACNSVGVCFCFVLAVGACFPSFLVVRLVCWIGLFICIRELVSLFCLWCASPGENVPLHMLFVL